MKNHTVALALLLAGCGDTRHPAASEPAAPTPSTAVLQIACGAGSLIKAINAANATSETTISLAAGCTYVLTDVNNLYDNSPFEFGANGLPLIIGSMTINGNGATIARSPVAPEFRIFYVFGPVSLTLNDLTISGGHIANSGGALVNHGSTVTLNRVAFSRNSAGDDGGAVVNKSGTMHVNASTFSGNSAGDDGGALHNDAGTVHVTASTISGNFSDDWGGGVSNFNGTIVFRTSTISANTAADHGGGIVNQGGTVTVSENTIVSGNVAQDDGGGLANYGAATVYVRKSTITVDNSTISGNRALDDGGGLSNAAGTVRIHASLISGNDAQDAGGGVRNENGGVLTLENSTLSANGAAEDGGGLHNLGATATVIRSTIMGNTARWGAGVVNEGGEIEIGEPQGSLNIQNSTLSGNRAAEAGGGLFNDAGGAFTLVHSTVSGNTALLKGGGGVWSYNDIDSRAHVKASIIAGNAPNDVAAGEDKTRYTSLGYNLIGRAGAYVDFTRDFRVTGDRRGVTTPGLSPLRYNGGPTLTCAILSGSLALNTGGAVCPPTDQRGLARPQGTACDIGAVEFTNTGGPLTAPPVLPAPPITRFPTDGWDEKNGPTLVEAGKLDFVTTGDGLSYEVEAGSFLALAFENIPRDATVRSVRLHVAADQETGFTAGATLWQVGGGTRSSPFAAMEYRPRGFERSVSWDLTPWVRTAARVNDLTLTIRNLDPAGKKIFVDQAYLEITYGPTPAKSATGFPVTLFVMDGWDSKDATTLAQTGSVFVINGSDGTRDEIEAPHFSSYRFQGIPAGAVIQSAKVYVEHHEEVGFGLRGAVWRVAGGSLTSPTTLAQRIPAVLPGELSEATVEWAVTAAINTATRVNTLKFVVRNQDLGRKKTKIDRVYVVVTHREP